MAIKFVKPQNKNCSVGSNLYTKEAGLKENNNGVFPPEGIFAKRFGLYSTTQGAQKLKV